MPDSPPRIIHMPLEELLDSDLAFDSPESAGDNPTAYVLKSDVDIMKKALIEIEMFQGPAAYERLPGMARKALDECGVKK